MMFGWNYQDMLSFMSGSSGWFWLMYLQWLVLWGLGVALLVAAIRWLWKKGGKQR